MGTSSKNHSRLWCRPNLDRKRTPCQQPERCDAAILRCSCCRRNVMHLQQLFPSSFLKQTEAANRALQHHQQALLLSIAACALSLSPTSLTKPSKPKQRFCTLLTNRKKQRSLLEFITHSLNPAMQENFKKQPQHNSRQNLSSDGSCIECRSPFVVPGSLAPLARTICLSGTAISAPATPVRAVIPPAQRPHRCTAPVARVPASVKTCRQHSGGCAFCAYS
jgi:hypothetical protein